MWLISQNAKYIESKKMKSVIKINIQLKIETRTLFLNATTFPDNALNIALTEKPCMLVSNHVG